MERSLMSLPAIRDHEILGAALQGRFGESRATHSTELAVRDSRPMHPTSTMHARPYPQNGCRPSPHPHGMPRQQHPHNQQSFSTDPNSRQSSVSTSPSYSNSSVDECNSSSMSSSSDTDENGHDRRARRGYNASKNSKEKKHRADLGLAMQTKQFILEFYCEHVEGNEQSAGNAKSSGLNFNKLDIDNASIALEVGVVDYLYKKALENGTVGELREWFWRLQTEYLKRLGDDIKDPTYGTLMYDAGPRCTRDVNGGCATHHEQDVNQCRRARARENFRRNEELYLQDCEPGSKKRRQA